MKLTYEDKVQIYELRKQGFSFPQLLEIPVFRINTPMMRNSFFDNREELFEGNWTELKRSVDFLE